MIRHYLKVAFRNMRKYRMQTLISIAGLATGFTCFALAALWIRYEMSFDSFHRHAKDIYCVYLPDVFSHTGNSRSRSPVLLAGYLEATFPEVVGAAAVIPGWPNSKIKVEDMEYPAVITQADSSFLSLFDVRLLAGSMDFLIPGSGRVAVTEELARRVFGAENPLGKKIRYWSGEYTVEAVVSGFAKQSNYRFDVLGALTPDTNWEISHGENILLRMAPGTDMKAFREKLGKHEVKQENRTISGMSLMPITELYYRDANAPRDVKFHHILIFAVSGSLLIACSLFNYVTLFLCRFRMRRKELALRRVCGASGRSLFVLLSLEFSLSLLAALLLGGVFVRLLYGVFGKLSGVDTELPAIYGESAVYAGAVTAFSLLVFGVVLQIFRRRMPAAAVRSGSRNRSRRASVVVQLFISVGFAFCTAVILKQMYYLHHTDLGFAFKNRGSVSIPGNRDWDVLRDRMSQLPEIGEVFCAQVALAPVLGRSSYGIGAWDEKPEDAPSVNIEQMSITEQYASYYEMRLTAGEMLRDSDPETLVMINESAAKAFGWHEPVGKKFNRYTVKGVLKNIYNFAPTVPAKPFFYNLPGKNAKLWNVLFRYREGSWETCREKIKEITGEVYPEDSGSITVYNTEEEYDKFLKSENALLKILTFVSSVCILICVFGFVSLISLTCEERRREMAIRKINGARVRDVLGIFIRENLVLLLAGSGLAFVAGYYVMRLWLEQYVVRTAMSWWIYVLIVCAMALVIVLCVGWRVYRASIENPAEVVKRE